MLVHMDLYRVYPEEWYRFSDSNLLWIREFLVKGADPNYRYYGGDTLFHCAVNNPFDNISVVREFIKFGANVNLSTFLDLTPLHFAAANRKLEVAKALIQSGASINARDFLGRTCLHFAVSSTEFLGHQDKYHFLRDSKLINVLLTHEDADLNAVDLYGETPLMMAVKDQQIIAAAQLLQKKANPNICNNNYETPLHAAFSLPPSCIQIQLLLSGADIYSLDKNGQTPLDILLKHSLSLRPYKWILSILKLIAFRYNITNDLKRKFHTYNQFSLIFNKYCVEIDRMRSDIISGKVTMHDFSRGCFDENDFKCLILQIYKPVIERLVRDIYPEYFVEIFERIPEFSLLLILQMTACSKKRVKPKGNRKDLEELFSIMDVIFLFSKYLTNVEIFCLIVALSNVINVESMQNIHEREFFYISDLS